MNRYLPTISPNGAIPTQIYEFRKVSPLFNSRVLIPNIMIRCANSLLRLTISLLLVFCAHPIPKECVQDTGKLIQYNSSMAHFGPAILGSTIAVVGLTSKTIYNSLDNFFQYALILDQALINLTKPLFSVLFNAIDCCLNKIWIDATATRAPPIFF